MRASYQEQLARIEAELNGLRDEFRQLREFLGEPEE